MNERIKELRKEIIKHDKLYSQNSPVISDSDYDNLYMELVELERLLPENEIPENSPTKRIYTVLVDSLKKVIHSEPMLSQEKIKTKDGIISFFDKTMNDILIQEKLDGLTIVLTYENGLLKQAVTRGNGKIGEDVTHTVMTIKSLPKKISFKKKLILRAEAILPLVEFERIIKTEDYANPRNLASGTIRQLDSSVANKRNMDTIIFEAIEIEGKTFQYDTERLEFLKELGFKVVSYEKFNKIQDVLDYCFSYNVSIRPNLEHLVDGLVLKVNDLELRNKLGTTSKYPKWSSAFKFEAVEAITVIKNVVFQVGKTGAITPVAEFVPTLLDGSVISKATLHNMDIVKEKDIRIGDKVVIIKSGDVIPKVVKVLLEERDTAKVKKIEITHCPDCNSKLDYRIKADGTKTSDLFCENPNCPSQILYKIVHFVSRDAMNIDGLGEETIKSLIDWNLIENIGDLYLVKNKEDIFVNIEGFGKKKFDKIVKSLEDNKEKPFNNVLYSLSIPKVGQNTSEILSKEFKSMTELLKRYDENRNQVKLTIENLEGIGNVVAEEIDFYLENNRDFIERLLSYGLKMEAEIIEISTDNQIADKKFVVTGSLEQFENRKALIADIKKNGGKSVGSVSANTDYLINNDVNSTSSKNKTAKKLGIPIITEDEYIKMKN